MNFTGLPNNMTYGDHYRVSIYNNCKPCPPNYLCDASSKSSSCSSPSLANQYISLNRCLREKNYRVQVCVRNDGKSVSLSFCKDVDRNKNGGNDEAIRLVNNHTALYNDKKVVNQRNESWRYLLYTEPDINKCLFSLPFFCEDQLWNYRTFRKLCQDDLEDGSKGPVYDCSLVHRWKEYNIWRNELCCSGDPEFRDIYSCKNNKCSDEPIIDNIILDKFLSRFVKEYGYEPPRSQPSGNFVMNVSLQENINHPNPFELFNEWERYQTDENVLKVHNKFVPSRSTPWKQTIGCCSCQPYPMPSFFTQNIKERGMPDNKHQLVTLTLTSIEKVSLTLVVELLHGLFYDEFDSYFRYQDKGEIYLHEPSRFTRSPKRSTWMAVIDQQVFTKSGLDLPSNLPFKKNQDGVKKLENSILIDRPSESYHGRMKSNSYSTIKEKSDKKLISKKDETKRLHDDIILDGPSISREDSTWWTTSDEFKFNFLTLPYLPFFSACSMYDSHIGLSMLLEDHPQCITIPPNETEPINEFSFFSSNPIADSCLGYDMKGIPLQCAFEENIEISSENKRWFESHKNEILFYLTKDPIAPGKA